LKNETFIYDESDASLIHFHHIKTGLKKVGRTRVKNPTPKLPFHWFTNPVKDQLVGIRSNKLAVFRISPLFCVLESQHSLLLTGARAEVASAAFFNHYAYFVTKNGTLLTYILPARPTGSPQLIAQLRPRLGFRRVWLAQSGSG
jgi:hypothetical protein